MSLIHFISDTSRNRRFLVIALCGIVIQFIVFKYFYPYADFFSDSYSYIQAAASGADISIWPIGYSKFLVLFHWFTHSDTILVGFQYFFFELTALYFFYSILFLFNPGKSSTIILFIFLFFNPLFLYVCNYVNSDPIFIALSTWWFTELLWIVHRPKWKQVFIQGILLFLAFTVRNNAYYYPIIAGLAFILSRQKLAFKVAGSLLGILLIIPFVIHSRNEAFKLTGKHRFSLFTGWQLANNALYMRGQITVDSLKLVTPSSKELDRLSIAYFGKKKADFRDELSSYEANYFIREPRAPLKRYYYLHYDKNKSDVENWGRASIAFDDYGGYLIRHYPFSYVKYFMVLNTKNYFMPPLEKLEVYNLGQNQVNRLAQDWFDYTSDDVTSASKTIQGTLLSFFPYLFMLINIYFIGSLIWFIYTRSYLKTNPFLTRSILLTCSFLVANFCFCVFATIIVFRYEIFPMIVCIPFTFIVVKCMDKIEAKTDAVSITVKNPMNVPI